MKFFPYIAIVLTIFTVAKAMSEDEMKDMMKAMSEECKKQEGATDDDVDKMANKEYPDTKEGKCMVACLQEQFGMTKDGEYQKENVQSLVEMMAGEDEDKKKAAGDIAEECKVETDPDKCEKAIKIAKCLEKAGRSRGFKGPGE